MIAEASLMSRVMDCLTDFPSPQEVIAFRASAEEEARIDYLANKHVGEGLTNEELEEYEACILANRMMSLAKIRAQVRLRKASAA